MLNTGNIVVLEKVFVKTYWKKSFENMLNLTKNSCGAERKRVKVSW